jgi:hypothetical protein
VARLMSRLRLISGVTRVSLADSTKQAQSQAGVNASAGPSGGNGTCVANAPTFDLVVFFQPLPGAVSSSATPGATTPPTQVSSTTSTTTQPGASAAGTASQQVSTTASTSTQPVINSAPSGSAK